MKRMISIMISILMVIMLSGCTAQKKEQTDLKNTAQTEDQTAKENENEDSDKADGGESKDETSNDEADEVNVYVLAGPTGVGAMDLWDRSDSLITKDRYNFTMAADNTDIVSAISNGDADIAAIATNMAAALYNKTDGKVRVLAVNTLGVLSILSNGTDIKTISDLKGKTVYAPGQGANPEYILRYVLKENGVDPDNDVNIEFVSDASELLNVWSKDPDALIMAPQPAASSLLMQYEGSFKALDMTEQWNEISDNESMLMMGCVIARSEFIDEHPDAVAEFLKEYEKSINKAVADPKAVSELCVKYGLIPKAPLATKAIPECGLTFMTGSEMSHNLSGYLKVMYEEDPSSVGGKLPDDDFYMN